MTKPQLPEWVSQSVTSIANDRTLANFSVKILSSCCDIIKQLVSFKAIKFTKRESVSELVSEPVSDKNCQWSDSGPIKRSGSKWLVNIVKMSLFFWSISENAKSNNSPSFWRAYFWKVIRIRSRNQFFREFHQRQQETNMSFTSQHTQNVTHKCPS